MATPRPVLRARCQAVESPWMCARVEVKGEQPEDVARDFLTEKGVIG